jgi:hypothetical protein
MKIIKSMHSMFTSYECGGQKAVAYTQDRVSDCYIDFNDRHNVSDDNFHTVDSL